LSVKGGSAARKGRRPGLTAVGMLLDSELVSITSLRDSPCIGGGSHSISTRRRAPNDEKEEDDDGGRIRQASLEKHK